MERGVNDCRSKQTSSMSGVNYDEFREPSTRLKQHGGPTDHKSKGQTQREKPVQMTSNVGCPSKNRTRLKEITVLPVDAHVKASPNDASKVSKVDDVTTIQEMDESGAVMRAFRAMGQVNVESGEFHVGNNVNVTHAHGDLHQHVDTVIKKQIHQTNYITYSDDVPGYDQISDQSVVDIASGESVFVETRAYRQAVNLITKHGLLLIHGPPGSGKSALGRALLRYFSKHEYTPLVLHTQREWRCHVGGKRRQVVWLDNVFGDVFPDLQAVRKWSRPTTIDCMVQYAKVHKCLVVFTSYAHITNEIRSNGFFVDFFKYIPILDLDALPQWTEEEQRDMAEKYLRGSSEVLSKPIVREILHTKPLGPVFPWVMKQYVEFAAGSRQRSSFVSTPEQAYLPFLVKALSDKDHGLHFAAMMLLTMQNKSDQRCFIENVQQLLHNFDQPDCSLVKSCKVEAMTIYFTGSYISAENGCFTSRVIYNAVGLALGASEFLPSLLKVCDIRFLVQYIVPEDASFPRALQLSGGSPGYGVLLERIYQEILDGNIPEICQLTSLQNKRVLEDLRNHCQAHGKFDTVLEAKDRKHKQTILYWSSFCLASVLTEWVLSEMLTRKSQCEQLLAEIQQALFVYALSGKTTSSAPMKTMTASLKLCPRRPYLHENLMLPLPSVKQQIFQELQTICQQIRKRTLPDSVCYLGNPALSVPKELLSLTTIKNKVHMRISGKHWYLALRLLSDIETDEQDHDGNTLLHVAAELGDVDDVKIAVQSGASLTAKNHRSATPPDVASQRRGKHTTMTKEMRLDVRQHTFLTKEKLSASGAFQRACSHGDVQSLKVMLCSDVGVNGARYRDVRPLHICCELGQTEVASLLLQLGADINATDYSGRTPLYCACKYGRKETASLLIANGAQLDWKKTCIHTTPCSYSFCSCSRDPVPLHAACECQSIEIVELLVQHGALVNQPDGLKRTALHAACETNNMALVSFLLENGADIHSVDDQKRTPLHVASEKDFLDIVAFLLQRGANVDAKDKSNLSAALFPACENGNMDIILSLIQQGLDIHVTDSRDRTPLSAACENGHGNIASMLIEHGANLDAKDFNMETPLHAACKAGFYNIAMLLIHKGADVNVFSSTKKTPLHLVSSSGHVDIVVLLLQNGASVNMQDTQMKTPLHGACQNAHYDIVTLLVNHKADVQLTDNSRDTPLHCACKAGNACIAAILTEYGADVNARNGDEQTAIFYASKYGYIEVVKLLLSKNPDLLATPKAKNMIRSRCCCCCIEYYPASDDSMTPLHAACMKGHAKIAELLLQHGADPNACDQIDRTPLHYACIARNEEIITMLCQHGADETAKDKKGNIPRSVERNTFTL